MISAITAALIRETEMPRAVPAETEAAAVIRADPAETEAAAEMVAAAAIRADSAERVAAAAIRADSAERVAAAVIRADSAETVAAAAIRADSRDAEQSPDKDPAVPERRLQDARAEDPAQQRADAAELPAEPVRARASAEKLRSIEMIIRER